MDQTKRMMLAVALSFGLITAWTFLFPQAKPEAPVATTEKTEAPKPVEEAVVPTMEAPSPVAAPERARPPLTTVKVQRDEVHYELSTQGASMTHAELQGVKMKEAQELSFKQGLDKLLGKPVPTPSQMDMAVVAAGQPQPFSLSIIGDAPFSDTAVYAVEEKPFQLSFTAQEGAWEVVKTLTWKNEGFEFGYDIELRNKSDAPLKGELVLHSVLGVDPSKEQAPSMLGGLGNQARATCFVDDSLKHLVPQNEVQKETFTGPMRFFGIDQTYFLAAIYPLDQARVGRCDLLAGPTARRADAAFPIEVGAGQSLKLPFGVFIGPKDAELLSRVSAVTGGAAKEGAAYRPQLEKSIDFGMFEIICRLLLAIMKVFYGWTGNWGVAVILLTVGVKLVLVPLTHKSMVAAENMKKLQPQMEDIRKKFVNDKERQNLEMMKLYQEAKVNPLGGCLPLLLQMPVWIALFTTLRTSYELYREPFYGALYSDLTAKDPIYLLPLLLGVSMVVTQKLQPQMMDATQAALMTWFMPIMFTALMLQYPSGLTLYIFTNNILSIAQQFLLKKYLEKKGVASPPPKASKAWAKGKA